VRLDRGERGSVTLWILGLGVMMLFLGGIAVDLWRAFGERRALAAAVDAAAVAGASGIDTDYFRATNQLRLDPGLAHELARQSLGSQPLLRPVLEWRVDATPAEVTVSATSEVRFTLLAILAREEPFLVRVRATAEPRRST